MSLGTASKTSGKEPLNVTISSPSGTMERLLSSGTHTFGGGLAADIVLPDVDSSELFAITRGDGESAFSLRILASGALLDGAEVSQGHKASGLTEAVITIERHSFDIRIVFPPKLSVKEKIAASTSGLKAGVNKLQDNPALADIRTKSNAIFTDVWSRQPKAVAALLSAGFLIVLASFLPSSLNGSLMGPSTSIPLPSHLQPIATGTHLAEELRRRLGAAELLPQIQIVEDGQSATLTGSVTSNENVRLTEILANLRARLRPPASINNLVTFAPPEDRHGIAGVALVPQKAILNEAGDMLLVGQTLPSGWRIVSIDEHFVELHRDGLMQKIPVSGHELRKGLTPPAGRASTPLPQPISPSPPSRPITP